MYLGYVILYVQNVAGITAFYEAAFGLRVKMVHPSGEYAELDTGGTTLAFASHQLAGTNGTPFAPMPPNGPAPAMEVALVTGDVPLAFQRAVAAGAVPVVPPHPKPWGQIVSYVRDPEGFLVELCTAVHP